MYMIETKRISAYLNLVARVLKVDKKAAKYLLKKAPNLTGFCYSGTMSNCFDWDNSPQGDAYWRDIHYRLCQGQ